MGTFVTNSFKVITGDAPTGLHQPFMVAAGAFAGYAYARKSAGLPVFGG